MGGIERGSEISHVLIFYSQQKIPPPSSMGMGKVITNSIRM